MDGDLVDSTDEGPPPLRRRARVRDDSAFADQVCGPDRTFDREQASRHISGSQRTGGAASIAILTFADGGMSDVPRRVMLCDSQWNHRQYARRHGYDHLWEDDQGVSVSDRTGHWNKILALARWLPRYDWVMWIDGDALFLNQSIALESVIKNATDGIAGPDGLGPRLILARDSQFLNTGVMILRGGEQSDAMEFLRAVYHYPNATEQPLADYNYWEQGAINFVLNGFPETRFTAASGWASVIGGRVLNARVGEFWPVTMEVANPDDTLVMHYPGFSGVRKMRRERLGPMAFSRGAVLASTYFAERAAAEVEACCLFGKQKYERRADGPVPPPLRGVEEPAPALMAALRAAKPPWRYPPPPP